MDTLAGCTHARAALTEEEKGRLIVTDAAEDTYYTVMTTVVSGN